MAEFLRMSAWARFLELLFPSRARVREARMRAGARWLLEHPDEPVYYADHGDGASTQVKRL